MGDIDSVKYCPNGHYFAPFDDLCAWDADDQTCPICYATEHTAEIHPSIEDDGTLDISDHMGYDFIWLVFNPKGAHHNWLYTYLIRDENNIEEYL